LITRCFFSLKSSHRAIASDLFIIPTPHRERLADYSPASLLTPCRLFPSVIASAREAGREAIQKKTTLLKAEPQTMDCRAAFSRSQ
jgi:hypothetical protein